MALSFPKGVGGMALISASQYPGAPSLGHRVSDPNLRVRGVSHPHKQDPYLRWFIDPRMTTRHMGWKDLGGDEVLVMSPGATNCMPKP